MKKIIALLIVSIFICGFSREWEAEDLSEDQQKAFITRNEFTDWVNGFTASLSEVDKGATQKIFDNMDFYDLQYKITIVYAFDENNGKWYSDSIERPEGIYKQNTSSSTEELRQQLENFRQDATQWEKFRRGLSSTHPDPIVQASGSRGYVFTAK